VAIALIGILGYTVLVNSGFDTPNNFSKNNPKLGHGAPSKRLARRLRPKTFQTTSVRSEKNEIGRTCSALGREERRIHGFGGGNLWVRNHSGDPDLDGRIILRWIFR